MSIHLTMTHSAIAVLAFLALATPAIPQSTPPPPEVSGFKTANGIRIVSRDPHNPFEIEFTGGEIKPQSTERLVWLIDGKRIELMSLRREWDVAPSASSLEVLRAFQQRELAIVHNSGWAQRGVDEPFSFPSGEPCLAFAVSRNASELMLYAATVNAGNVIVLVASGVDPGRMKEIHDYLHYTLLSLRRGKLFQRPNQHPDPENVGGTIVEQIRVFEALTGQRHVALLNNKLMTPSDANLGAAIPLDPITLQQIALLQLNTGVPIVSVVVFDGQKAHAINLQGYDETAATIKYWDPWGKSSFLAAQNNRAGISAVPHPTEARMWLIKSQELRQVLYAIFLSLTEVKALFRACTLLAGSPDKAIAAYEELQTLDPKSSELSDQRLKNIQELLLRRHNFEQAVAMYRIRVALNSAAVADKAHMATVLRAAGQTSLSDQLDKPPHMVQSARPFRGSLTEAKSRGSFFTFFHLQQAGSNTDSHQNTVVTFKPTAPEFHDLVDVAATLNRDSAVGLWTLSLARSFIDDPRIGPFANDIAKSFLQFTISQADNDPAGDVASEIWRAQSKSVPLIAAAVPGTSVPAVASEAYLTYSGSVRQYEHRLAGGTLRLENAKIGETTYLLISIDSRQ
jgi:tetratricopeptide (TPR) repeat protein